MFLLIRKMCKEQRERELNLHSTMFLLILDALKAQSKTEIAFTFHNVSINSSEVVHRENRINKFTFHNVSINSRVTKVCSVCYADLHSTMFLLIQYHVYYLLLHLCYLHSTMFLLIHEGALFLQ